MAAKAEAEAAIADLNEKPLRHMTINVVELPSLFQITKIRDSYIAEDQATSVEESEKEDTKSVELPAMS